MSREKKFEFTVQVPDDATPEEEKRIIDRAVNEKVDEMVDKDIDEMLKGF